MGSRVSVVIPCFNQGMFVDEAVDSVLGQTFQDFEIIIVNDGSTDKETNLLLANYQRPKTRVVHTSNRGVASARNCGIAESEGEYILPLDADDRIGPCYLERAVKILDEDQRIGIVYCHAEFFGDRHGRWFLPDYSLKEMLLYNVIFCSAVFRKSDWEKVGGYKFNMDIGLEDWDFWLSLIEAGAKVYKIPEVLFYYRIKNVSRTKSIDFDKQVDMHMQIVMNHKDLYAQNIRPLLSLYYRITGSKFYKILKRLRIPYFFSNKILKRFIS